MDILNTLILIGGGATAIIAIITLTVKLVKVCKTVINFINTLKGQVDTLITHDKSQYLSILRLTITADHMPMSERLRAGRKYVAEGGNGDVKKLYESLKRRCNELSDNDDDQE